MVQEGEVAGGAPLITPRRLPNPCLDSPQRMDLHRELMFNQKMSDYESEYSVQCEPPVQVTKPARATKRKAANTEPIATNSGTEARPSGKNVLNQKSELQKALSKHKERQILNQVKEHRETPELERAIAERARRLEQAEQGTAEEVEPGTSPELQEIRARLRHAAPAPPLASLAPGTPAH